MRLSTESIVEKTQWIDMLEQVLSNFIQLPSLIQFDFKQIFSQNLAS